MIGIHTCLLLALASGFVVTGGPDDPEPARFEVVLKPHAMVRGTEVTIGELADILPPGREAHEIGQLVFGKPPIPGFTRSISRNQVLHSLVMAGHTAGRFTFKGASEVVIQPVFTDLPITEVLEAADTVLRAIIDLEPESDIEYELAARPRAMRIPPGRRSLEFRARVRDDRTSLSTAVVEVDVLVDGEKYKAVPLQYRLTRYQRVLKTSRSIRKGLPLGPENLVLSREKVTQTQGLYVQAFADVTGMIARRNLQGNRLLTLGDVAEPALIRKGQLVTVVIQQGRIKVTTKALANHDAIRGDLVTLTNLKTQQPITGVAYAPGTVVVPTSR